MQTCNPITIRDLYPEMTDTELSEAETNLKRFVAVIVRICDRLQAEGKRWPGPPDLTLSPDDFTIPDERSNSQIAQLTNNIEHE